MTYQTSFYPSITSQSNTIIDLSKVLFVKDKRAINLVNIVRNCPSEDKRKNKQLLPVFTPSATFENGHQASNLIHFNGLLQFDIDGKDNPDLTPDLMKQTIMQSALKPYIYYLSLSCSGLGVWGLVKTDGSPTDYKGHFAALTADLSNIGAVADNSCSDITRLRFISYDDSPYFAPDSEIYSKTTAPPRAMKPTHSPKWANISPPTPFTPLHPSNPISDTKKMNIMIQNIERNNLILSHNHQYSQQIISALINTFDAVGIDYWLTIRQQRIGYDAIKHTNDYLYALKKKAHGGYIGNYSLGLIINKYRQSGGQLV